MIGVDPHGRLLFLVPQGLPDGRLTAPAPSTADVLAAFVAEVDLGCPVDNLVLVCCLEDGSRYEIGAGEELVDAALAAAGRPRARNDRRRTASA